MEVPPWQKVVNLVLLTAAGAAVGVTTAVFTNKDTDTSEQKMKRNGIITGIGAASGLVLALLLLWIGHMIARRGGGGYF